MDSKCVFYSTNSVFKKVKIFVGTQKYFVGTQVEKLWIKGSFK
jgi:hypothetical protein